MWNLFRNFDKKETPIAPQKKEKKQRFFNGARFARNNRFNATFDKINAEIRTDYIALTLRARSLVKNNETVNSYINLMLRSVLGNTGFILNCTSYNADGTSDKVANEIIQDHWNEYTKSYKNYVSADEQSNGLDFDKQVLFNYLVDGEVFIRKVKDSKSKYGIRFQIIDALDVDVLYSFEGLQDGYRICTGIKVDEHCKPISYFIRKNKSLDYYMVGERVEVPASEIIHIYQKTFANQVRGYTPLAPVLLSLNSLDEYKRAEIDASLLNASFMGIWEKQTQSADAFSQYDQQEVDEKGDVAVQLESNVFRYAPDGFKLNQIASNHPNSNVGGFYKAMLKGIAGALGMSYNKISSDYESTSYSSLRQSNMQDEVTIKELQQMLIDKWKQHQYAQFLKYLLLSDLTNLPYSRIEKFMAHTFQGRNFEYLDPQKEMQSIQMRLALGLSSPIEEIHNLGRQPEDVLNSWAKWNAMLKDRGLKIANTMEMIQGTANVGEDEIEKVIAEQDI